MKVKIVLISKRRYTNGWNIYVNNYNEIQEDIIRRSDKYYYKTYYLINKKGYARAQNRKDTFSRHYIIKDNIALLYDINKLYIKTVQPREEMKMIWKIII